MKRVRIGILGAALFGQAAFAAVITYTGTLSGSAENPPNASPGTGFAMVTIDNLANTMEVNVTFSGLLTTDTASHIHCCVVPGGNAGVATQIPTFTGFPLNVTSGSYDHVFDLTLDSTYNPAFETAEGGTAADAEAALLTGLGLGDAYLNIHTTGDPLGEVRAFLTTTPEPTTFGLVGAALAGLGFLRTRKRPA